MRVLMVVVVHETRFLHSKDAELLGIQDAGHSVLVVKGLYASPGMVLIGTGFELESMLGAKISPTNKYPYLLCRLSIRLVLLVEHILSVD